MKRYGRIPTLGDVSTSFQSGAYAAGMNAMYLQAQPGSGVDANKVIVAALANPALNNTSYSNASGSLINDVAAINAATAPGAPGVSTPMTTPTSSSQPTAQNSTSSNAPTPTQVHITDPSSNRSTSPASAVPGGVMGYLVNGQQITNANQIPSGFVAVGYAANGLTVYGPQGSPVGIYDFSSGKITDSSGRLIGLITSGAPVIGYDDKGNALSQVPIGYVQVGTAQNGLPIYALGGASGSSTTSTQDTTNAMPAPNSGQDGGGGFMLWLGLGAILLFALNG